MAVDACREGRAPWVQLMEDGSTVDLRWAHMPLILDITQTFQVTPQVMPSYQRSTATSDKATCCSMYTLCEVHQRLSERKKKTAWCRRRAAKQSIKKHEPCKFITAHSTSSPEDKVDSLDDCRAVRFFPGGDQPLHSEPRACRQTNQRHDHHNTQRDTNLHTFTIHLHFTTPKLKTAYDTS